jgi:pilus assembly protein Flp/PilA
VTISRLIVRVLVRLRRDEGQDLLEYALLIALIALVCVGAIGLAGSNVNAIFGSIAAALAPSS